MKHNITDITFHGNADRGCLEYWADGVFISIDGQFFIDSSGVVHHQHWFDEEGKDVAEVLFHTKEENLEYAAYKAGHGDDVVTTTETSWGPTHRLKKAVIGFDSYAEAQSFAESIENGILVFLTKKDGHQYWTVRDRAWAPFQLTADDYGDDFMCYDDADEYWADIWEVLREEMLVKPADILDHLETIRNNYDTISGLDDNQQLLIHNGSFHTEVIPKKAMKWSHDTWTHTIGVMQNY